MKAETTHALQRLREGANGNCGEQRRRDTFDLIKEAESMSKRLKRAEEIEDRHNANMEWGNRISRELEKANEQLNRRFTENEALRETVIRQAMKIEEVEHLR